MQELQEIGGAIDGTARAFEFLEKVFISEELKRQVVRALEEYMRMNVSDLPWLLSCLRSSDKRKRTRMDLDGGSPRDPTTGTIDLPIRPMPLIKAEKMVQLMGMIEILSRIPISLNLKQKCC